MNPVDVEISEPPIIANNKKRNDNLISGEYVVIPEFDIDDIIDKKTLEKLSPGIRKK